MSKICVKNINLRYGTVLPVSDVVSTLAHLAAGSACVTAEEGPATGPEDGPAWMRATKRGLL